MVLVTDHAGNKTNKELDLQIDTILPELKVQCFRQSDFFSGYYSKVPIAVQILYKERNFYKGERIFMV